MEEHISQTALKGISVVLRLKTYGTKTTGGILNKFLASKYTKYIFFMFINLFKYLQ